MPTLRLLYGPSAPPAGLVGGPWGGDETPPPTRFMAARCIFQIRAARGRQNRRPVGTGRRSARRPAALTPVWMVRGLEFCHARKAEASAPSVYPLGGLNPRTTFLGRRFQQEDFRPLTRQADESMDMLPKPGPAPCHSEPITRRQRCKEVPREVADSPLSPMSSHSQYTSAIPIAVMWFARDH